MSSDNPWELTEEEIAAHWAESVAQLEARGIRYPRSDVLHPEHQQWLEKKLPLYGEAEKAAEAPQKPPKRSRDTKLATAPEATRKRDTKLPRRKASPVKGTPE